MELGSFVRSFFFMCNVHILWGVVSPFQNSFLVSLNRPDVQPKPQLNPRPVQPLGPGVLAISIPKSGTHLIGKLLNKLGYAYQGIPTDTALLIKPHAYARLLGKKFFSPHLIASSDNMNGALKYGLKVIFLYRDPRDQIVSNAYYMKKTGAGLWVDSDLPLPELISKLIVDYSVMYYTKEPCPWNDMILKTIGHVKNFYDLYQGWHDYPGIYITTFEKLIGSQGGGCNEVQYQEINNISHHLGLNLSEEAVEAIQLSLFGGTGTFRAGLIGSWKEHFTLDDKEIFKRVAGQLLIDLGYEQDLNW